MWTYLVATLGRQRARSAFATTGFLLAACTLILLSAATQTTVLRGNQLISQNWHPPMISLCSLHRPMSLPGLPFLLICSRATAEAALSPNIIRFSSCPVSRWQHRLLFWATCNYRSPPSSFPASLSCLDTIGSTGP
jgi:hypothetical protein